MKKCFEGLFTILIVAGSGFAAYGKSVGVNTAMTTGSNFLMSVGVNNAASLTLAYTQTDVVKGTSITDFYVFNVTGSKAFVMVSADDHVIPILAYSNTSPFDINNISPSTIYWISGYQKQITALIANDWPARPGTAQRWNDLKTGSINTRSERVTSTTGVSPLVQTTWDQDYGGGTPYNAYCPNTSTTGGLSVTGCVATAMAQVMKFWNWPSVGCGNHTYYDAYSSSEGSGSNTWNSFNYANTAFNWSSMSTSLSGSNAAVATLMYAAGVSVNMSYSAGGSGAYVLSLETYGINCAQYALWAYFHYKPSTLQGISRFGETQGYGDPAIDSIAEAAWITMLQTELNAGRPMLYDGEGAVGGHCWILDGWEASDSMFHFNWGWSGFNDAYYTVNNLDPSGLGGGANLDLDQGVIMGIEPDSFPSTPGNLELLAPLNANVSSPMPYKSPFAITTKILNTDTTSYIGNFCAQVYDSSNNLVATIATITGDTIATDSSATLTFSNTGIDAMVPFLYSIRVLYQPAGTGTWMPVANNGTFINYTMLGVNNDTDVVLYDSLHIGSHTVLADAPFSVTTTIGDQSQTSTSFTGTVQAVLINVATGTQYTVQQLTDQTIDTTALGSTFTFSCSATPAPGLYALAIQHQYNGTGSFYTTSSDYYSNPVLINVIVNLSIPTVTTMADNVYVYPNPAKDNVTIATQGAAITAINVMDITGRTVRTVVGGVNQSMVSFPVNDLAAGTYLVQVETATGTVTKKIVINR